MIINILKSINWADLIILALFLRIMYMAVHEGLIVEAFKCFSMAIALFLSFHYYVVLAKALTKGVNGPEDMVFTLSFSFIAFWLPIVIVFKYIREGLLLLFSIKTKTVLDTWGGAVLGMVRSLVTASMVMFVLLISGFHYFETRMTDSFLGRRVVTVAPGIYQKMCNGFVSRLFPNEKYNQAVREALEKVSKK